VVEGFQLDRGFQVLLTAYPECRAVLEYEALNLQPFHAGALVASSGGFQRVADPWRHPLDGIRSVFSRVGGLLDKLRVARLRSRVTRGNLDALFSLPETTSQQFLLSCGFSNRMIDQFFRPFFGGVFLEPDLTTSSRMLQFVFRMFASGDTVLPAKGMGAIPGQLVSQLPQQRIRLQTRVVSIDGTTVTLASGERLEARAIVVATEGSQAARLIAGLQPPRSRSVSCLYFAAEKPPIDEAILVLNPDRRQPVNNLCVPSNAAPGYAPPGGSLISASVLGDLDIRDDDLEQHVRSHLSSWFGSDVDNWRHLRTYRIQHALPVIEPRWTPGPDRPTEVRAGLYVCGDHRENPSIQGAMASGRRAAERVLADLE
jgi:phytoene dehydrogenase-like protein